MFRIKEDWKLVRWQLPTYDGTKSYQNLLVGVYGGTVGGSWANSNLSTIIQVKPINVVLGGNYAYYSGDADNRASLGLYLVSSPHSATNVRHLAFYSSSLYPQNYSYTKGYGYTFRCLVSLESLATPYLRWY